MLLNVINSDRVTLCAKLNLMAGVGSIAVNVFLGCVSLSRVAHAAAIAPCDEPFVYEKAAVNVIVLPYSYLPAPGQHFPRTGEKLAALVQADTLYSILKFNSIGVVQLYGRPEDCTPKRVTGKLLSQGAFDWNKPAVSDVGLNTAGRHGLILIWGSIYEEGENIFVQTFLSFRRRDEADPGENVYFKVGQGYLVGGLSSQELSFPPRRITTQDLARIEDKFRSTAILRERADESSPKVMALVGTQTAPMQSWSVLETSGEWIHLEVRQGRHGAPKSGWLHARIDLGALPLNSILPELHYIEGLVGYFRYRILGGGPGIGSAARQAFEKYPLPSEDDPNPLPSAVLKQLLGFLDLLDSHQDHQGMKQAREEFYEAFRLAPFSAEAGNLELITRVALSFVPGGQPIGSRVFTEDMLRVSALDPANSELRRNLAALYRYSERPEVLARVPADERLKSPEQVEKIKDLENAGHDHVYYTTRPPSDWPIGTPIV